jgi:hypothetical protein
VFLVTPDCTHGLVAAPRSSADLTPDTEEALTAQGFAWNNEIEVYTRAADPGPEAVQRTADALRGLGHYVFACHMPLTAVWPPHLTPSCPAADVQAAEGLLAALDGNTEDPWVLPPLATGLPHPGYGRPQHAASLSIRAAPRVGRPDQGRSLSQPAPARYLSPGRRPATACIWAAARASGRSTHCGWATKWTQQDDNCPGQRASSPHAISNYYLCYRGWSPPVRR